ncbi:MAG: alkene reductase [Pseudobdellovibrio sp.]
MTIQKLQEDSDLFKPIRVGALTLANRIVMAPLTRSRVNAGDVPTLLNATYYEQRAGAGLIISEATNISQQGKGYAFTPGIYTEDQISGWKIVTDAVHKAKGLIYCQLWHVGRISHPSLQKDGELPVSASEVKPMQKAFTEKGMQDCVAPRALRLDELPGVVEQYRHAALCAKKAGFDGVEIHSANGYLLQQFISDKTNLRTDQYGGSIENRCRLVLEVAKAVIDIWGSDRVGIRFSPVSPANDMHETDPMKTYSYLAEKMNPMKLAYVHLVEGSTGGARDIVADFDYQGLRKKFGTLYMANNGYDLKMALDARKSNTADLICFGRPFISNPDLVERFKRGLPLTPLNPETLYGGDQKGYTDYPNAT